MLCARVTWRRNARPRHRGRCPVSTRLSAVTGCFAEALSRADSATDQRPQVIGHLDAV